jgi:tetratricopeptide (TPR) repeat protein
MPCCLLSAGLPFIEYPGGAQLGQRLAIMTAEDRRITAAQGYLELGLHEDALAELQGLSAQASCQPEALEAFVLYHVHLQQWELGLGYAEALCIAEPKGAGGYIHTAYCLHELGRTAEAAQRLESGPAVLKKQAVYFYNLGCYYTRLGELPKAVRLLRRSFEMDGSLRKTARADPDLIPLMSELP